MTFLRKILVLALPLSILAESYQLTPHLYPAVSNHDHVCKVFYGEMATVADFSIDLKPMGYVRLEALLDELDIKETINRYYFFVQNNGEDLKDPKSAFFFENHGGAPPSFFPTVDNIENKVTLGATDKYGHILCKVEEALKI